MHTQIMRGAMTKTQSEKFTMIAERPGGEGFANIDDCGVAKFPPPFDLPDGRFALAGFQPHAFHTIEAIRFAVQRAKRFVNPARVPQHSARIRRAMRVRPSIH
jgi:hypothetical protein